MKKVIIHVGQYKTGSTSIQKLLWESRGELLQHGILYPRSFVRDGAHFLLTDLLRKEFRDRDDRVDLAPLRAEIDRSPATTVVLSCEALSGATVRRFASEMMMYMWQRLATTLCGYDVRVMFYVRRQDESIDSRIIQEIKGQARKSTGSHLPFLYPMSSLDYHYFTRLLEQVFGSGKVDVRLYDRSCLKNSDVRADFLAYLGLAEDAIPLPEREDNVSPSARLVGYYRIINALELDSETHAEVCRGLWREFNAGGKPKAVALGSYERLEVMRYFEEKNRKFIAESVPFTQREQFSATLFRSVRELEANIFVDGVEAMKFLDRKGFALTRKPVRQAGELKVIA
jgi:hypothetical protein